MKLNIKKFAELTGVSIRTLHYYDKIGLLKPDFVDSNSGYRFYEEYAFSRMQEILFYRSLDFSLKEISEILSSADYDKQKALEGQKKLLLLKKQRLERMIDLIERMEKGVEIDMKLFNTNEYEKAKDMYRSEVKQRWGNTNAYAEYKQKTAKYTNDDWSKIGEDINAIIAEFAMLNASGVKAADKAALELVRKLQEFITKTQYTCTNEIIAPLGEMYVSDKRFKKNIDKHGEGTAEFMDKAIMAYCEK